MSLFNRSGWRSAAALYPRQQQPVQWAHMLLAGRKLGCRMLAGALLILAACDKPAVAPPDSAALQEGRAFPAPVLDFVSGGRDAQGPLAGKWLVLNVWATWCAPCRSEMPSLQRLSQRLDPAHFAVVGLSVDADALLAAEFLLQHGIRFGNVVDKGGVLTRSLGLKAYPETFLIAPDRRLMRRIAGRQQWDSAQMLSMLEGMQALAPSTALAPAQVRNSSP
jgi:thiol-disulfide isomerase/thioredoxin